MSAPTKPLDPYTLRHLARLMRQEARGWTADHLFDRGAQGRLICWARECEWLARAEERRRESAGD